MSEIQLIVTHPGGAHKDDFLACAVLLARHPAAIERRDPTATDLSDATVCVVDVGGEHDPEKKNFDHHHFDRDGAPTCALSLVLKWFDLYEDARAFCDWLEMAEWLDCRGANGTARQFGFERELLGQLLSPIDVTLLRRFAQSPRLEPGDTLWAVMRWIGSDLLEYIESMSARMAAIAGEVQYWDFDYEGDLVRVLFIERKEPASDDASMGLGRFIDQLTEGPPVIGTIVPDRRGMGYGLSRHNDDPRLDFTRIEGEDDVHFAHKSGFVAKTSATDLDRLRTLFKRGLGGL